MKLQPHKFVWAAEDIEILHDPAKDDAVQVTFKRFDRNQPRWPAGTERGGQWRGDGPDLPSGLLPDQRDTYRFVPREPSTGLTSGRMEDRGAYHPPGHSPKEKMAALEMQRIGDAIHELAPRPLTSKWDGTLHLPSRGFHSAGAKDTRCFILIKPRVYNESWYRYSTMPHEYLHSVSNAPEFDDYMRYTGWEEGPVEGLTRLLRPRILAKLNKPARLDAEAQRNRDDLHPYTEYVEMWRDMADALEYDGEEATENFLWDMLAVPLRERHTWVNDKGRELYGDDPEKSQMWTDFYDIMHGGLTTGHRVSADWEKYL